MVRLPLAICLVVMTPGLLLPADWVSFDAPRVLSTGYPNSVAVGDFNGDGNQDLAVANGKSGTVSVLLGNGHGGFQPAVNYTVKGFPDSVVVGDFNQDGKPDLAVSNLASNSVFVLLGNGKGNFQNPVEYPAGSGARGLAVGDFNRDGKPDLAVADNYSNAIAVLEGNGDGSFQPPITFAVGNAPTAVAVGDFNGDGKPDIVVANEGARIPGANGSISVLIGTGHDKFQPAVNYGAGSFLSVSVADFNGNGSAPRGVIHGRLKGSVTNAYQDGNGVPKVIGRRHVRLAITISSIF